VIQSGRASIRKSVPWLPSRRGRGIRSSPRVLERASLGDGPSHGQDADRHHQGLGRLVCRRWRGQDHRLTTPRGWPDRPDQGAKARNGRHHQGPIQREGDRPGSASTLRLVTVEYRTPAFKDCTGSESTVMTVMPGSTTWARYSPLRSPPRSVPFTWTSGGGNPRSGRSQNPPDR
jgi:hypothetical protein